MPRSLAICRLLMLAAMLPSMETLAADAPVDLSGAGVRGRLARVVKPDYPRHAVLQNLTGEVTLEGAVRPDGFIDDVTYTPDKPESAVFVESLKAVVPNWTFRPLEDNECQPIASPVRVKVSFEMPGGEPKIFVTHAAAPGAGTPPGEPGKALVIYPHYRPLQRVQPEFPMGLLKRGIWGDTYTMITVDREGKVIAFKSRSYARLRDAPDVTAFDEAAKRALTRWQFPPVPPENKAPWFGCYRIEWRVTR